MSADRTITFYDIASGPPVSTFAPNPWKTRYALNHKRVDYKTEAVDLPDITSLRTLLGVPANRTHKDGTPYHTLPCIQDHFSGKVVGDSFEIATYLETQYPDGPALFRPHTVGLVAAFNAHVDEIFTKHVMLCDHMPFDGHSREEEIKNVLCKRWGMESYHQFKVTDQAREKAMVSFERALGEFFKAYSHVGGTTDYFIRPEGTGEAQKQTSNRKDECLWLDGNEPVYADFIVGGWLAMCSRSMRHQDWEQLRSWQGGFWGKLHDALEPLREMK